MCPANQGPPQHLVSPTEYEDKGSGVSCYLAHQVSEDTDLRYFAPGDPGIAVTSNGEVRLSVLRDQQKPLCDSGHAQGPDQPVSIRHCEYSKYARAANN